MGDICAQLVAKTRNADLANYFYKIGNLQKGESYGVWTLLNNKRVVRSMTAITAEDTKVFYFSRHHFFDALNMELNTTNPRILRVINTVPCFRLRSNLCILNNVSKFDRINFIYGQKITCNTEDANFIWILREGTLKIEQEV